MTYKLIIFDLDHTLLREDHTLSETTIDTVGRCQKAGIGVTLATGRRLPSALPYAHCLSSPVRAPCFLRWTARSCTSA